MLVFGRSCWFFLFYSLGFLSWSLSAAGFAPLFSVAAGFPLAGRCAFLSEGLAAFCCCSTCLSTFGSAVCLFAAGRVASGLASGLASDFAAGLDSAAAGMVLRVSLCASCFFGVGAADSCVTAAAFATGGDAGAS